LERIQIGANPEFAVAFAFLAVIPEGNLLVFYPGFGEKVGEQNT